MPRVPANGPTSYPSPPPPTIPAPLPLGSFEGEATPLGAFSFTVYPAINTEGVQGVGFRKAAARHAATINVSGWSRNNTANETVEGCAEGDSQGLAEFKRWLSEVGPPRSGIAFTAFTDAEGGATRRRPRAYKGFRVAPTVGPRL